MYIDRLFYFFIMVRYVILRILVNVSINVSEDCLVLNEDCIEFILYHSPVC